MIESVLISYLASWQNVTDGTGMSYKIEAIT
jgi:hypothetical protein